MKRTTVFFTENQDRRLKSLVKTSGITTSEHFRRALDQYLDREEKKLERKR